MIAPYQLPIAATPRNHCFARHCYTGPFRQKTKQRETAVDTRIALRRPTGRFRCFPISDRVESNGASARAFGPSHSPPRGVPCRFFTTITDLDNAQRRRSALVPPPPHPARHICILFNESVAAAITRFQKSDDRGHNVTPKKTKDNRRPARSLVRWPKQNARWPRD